MTDLQDAIAARKAEKFSQERAFEAVQDPDLPLSQRIQQRRELRKQGVQTGSPQAFDAGRRREALGAQVGGEIGEPGFTDLGARADIGLSTTFEEKRGKFMDKFPEGDFIQARDPGGGTTVLFRKSQDEDFAEFDAGMLEKFEFMGDLTDISGEIPSALTELIVTRGGGLARQALSIFLGNVAGEAAKEGIEELRGFQKETFGEVAERSLIQAAVAAGAVVPSVVVTGPINAFRGASLMKVTPGAKLAQQSASELGLPRLLPSQIAQSPLVRRLGGQSGAIVTTIGEYIRQQNKAAVGVISRLREPGLVRLLKGELRKLHDEASEQILEASKVVGTSLSEGGTAIQEGIAEYDSLARAVVDRSYLNARNISEPEFSASALFDVATEVRARAEKLGPDGASVVALADSILAKDPSLPVETLNLPSGETIEFSATEQLRFLRSQAFDLKRPEAGNIARAQHREASKLNAVLNKTLNEAQGSEEFVKAWQKANALAKDRFSTMEKLTIIQASRSETPAILADRLAKPLQVDNLKTLKDTVAPAQFKVFQDAVKTDLISPRNIDNLITRLDAFDKPTLDLLLEPADQRALKITANNWEKLKSLGIEDVLTRQKTQVGIINELVQSGQTRRIAALAEASNSRPALRKSIRAGLLEDVWSKSVKEVENEFVVDAKALREQLKVLRDSGADAFLKAGDVTNLRKLSEAVEFIPAGSDSGTSLQSASAVASARELGIEGFRTILENIGVGRLLTSDVFGRILSGTGKEALPFNSVRVFAATLADIAVSMENEQASE